MLFRSSEADEFRAPRKTRKTQVKVVSAFLTRMMTFDQSQPLGGLAGSMPLGAAEEFRRASAKKGAAEAAAAGEGTSSVTGSSFFAASEPSGLLRFCFALEDEPLDRACEALAQLG